MRSDREPGAGRDVVTPRDLAGEDWIATAEGTICRQWLNRMQNVASQSNLTIKTFKPGATVTRQLHAEWPINLELEGTYHNLALFFDRVGKFTRIVNVSGVDIKAKDKPEPNATITASCVATTFVLLDKPVPPKPVAPPAAPGKPAGRGA